MLRIVLIRPGSTEFDAQGRILGTLDLPLSEKGEQEVASAIEPLRAEGIDVIYVSPTEAAEQTAGAIGEALGTKVKSVEKLQNLDQGLWQGMLIDDVKTKQPKVYRQWQDNPEKICPPEGEMLSQAQDRARGVVTKIARKHKDGVVGLIVPEPLASLIAGILREETVADLWKPALCGTWETIPVPTPVVAGNT